MELFKVLESVLGCVRSPERMARYYTFACTPSGCSRRCLFLLFPLLVLEDEFFPATSLLRTREDEAHDSKSSLHQTRCGFLCCAYGTLYQRLNNCIDSFHCGRRCNNGSRGRILRLLFLAQDRCQHPTPLKRYLLFAFLVGYVVPVE